MDFLGLNVGRRSVNKKSITISAIALAKSICSNTSSVQVFRKHPGKHFLRRNTDSSDKCSSNTLPRTFSIHIFETNIDKDEDIAFGSASDISTDKTTSTVPEEEENSADPDHPRFGHADYSTIISSNLIADNNPFSWAQLGSQVAGHGLDEDMRLNNVPSILITSEGQILKPVQIPQGKQPRGLTEVAFYSHITHSKDQTDRKIRECIPQFFGIEQFESDNGENSIRNFLVLEDITQGYKLPAVMDVKIGRIVYGPDASKSKRAKTDRKNIGTRYSLGYSVSGILSHSLKPEDEGKTDLPGKQYSKSGFGKKLTTDTVWKVPEAFYDVQNSGKVDIVNDVFLRKLEHMRKVFEEQSQYHIYGSSLLLAYDADAVRSFRNGKIQADILERFINVKLIDFANVYESNGENDDNFLDGFKSFYYMKQKSIGYQKIRSFTICLLINILEIQVALSI